VRRPSIVVHRAPGGEERQLGARAEAQLAEEGLEGRLDRSDRHLEAAGDLGVGQAGRDQAGETRLVRAEPAKGR
jgi:hypothetical protein